LRRVDWRCACKPPAPVACEAGERRTKHNSTQLTRLAVAVLALASLAAVLAAVLVRRLLRLLLLRNGLLYDRGLRYCRGLLCFHILEWGFENRRKIIALGGVLSVDLLAPRAPRPRTPGSRPARWRLYVCGEPPRQGGGVRARWGKTFTLSRAHRAAVRLRARAGTRHEL